MMESDFEEYGVRGRVRDVIACKPWVEARFPFESHRSAEFADALPMDFKIRDGVRKAVLRRAAVVLGSPRGGSGGAEEGRPV